MKKDEAKPKNLIWLNPQEIKDITIPRMHRFLNRNNSGKLFAGTWDADVIPLENHAKAVYCRQRWEQGLPWSQTIALQFYKKKLIQFKSYDKCKSVSDVEDRLTQLDSVFESIYKAGQLSTRFSLGLTKSPSDESGGVYVHINRKTSPIFSGGGFHRLMITRILRFDVIPVQVGIIHQESKLLAEL